MRRWTGQLVAGRGIDDGVGGRTKDVGCWVSRGATGALEGEDLGGRELKYGSNFYDSEREEKMRNGQI